MLVHRGIKSILNPFQKNISVNVHGYIIVNGKANISNVFA